LVKVTAEEKASEFFRLFAPFGVERCDPGLVPDLNGIEGTAFKKVFIGDADDTDMVCLAWRRRCRK
jgi:hypothetical protein